MPTGYTADLYDGEQVFEDFVLTCARAFGALIHQRDDSLKTRPKFLPEQDQYYADALERAKDELEFWRTVPLQEAARQAKVHYKKRLKAHVETQQKQSDRMRRFHEMKERVKAWEPPTDEHKGLKQFMPEQLDTETPYSMAVPLEMTGEEYRNDQFSMAQRNVTYYTEQLEKSRERARTTNAWIQALYDSLEQFAL